MKECKDSVAGRRLGADQVKVEELHAEAGVEREGVDRGGKARSVQQCDCISRRCDACVGYHLKSAEQRMSCVSRERLCS